MKKRSILHASLLSAVALFCGATTANADLVIGESILLDFGNQGDTGGSVLPANTNRVLNGGSANALTTVEVLGSGATRAVGVEAIGTLVGGGTGGTFTNGGPTPGTASIPAPFNAAILDDWIGIASSGSLDILFSGLDDSLTYEITYALGGFTDGPGQTSELILGVDGQTQSAGPQSADGRFVTFTGLSTDSSGNLVFEVGPAAGVTGSGVAGSVSVISGLQLTALAAIPEPSSFAVLGLAGFGMLVRRRK